LFRIILLDARESSIYKGSSFSNVRSAFEISNIDPKNDEKYSKINLFFVFFPSLPPKIG